MRKQYAITSKGKTLRSFHDQRFGQCRYLVIHTPGDEVSKLIQNPFRDGDDSDFQLAGFLINSNVDALIFNGTMDPKAEKILRENKIQVIVLDEVPIRIEEILTRLG